MAKLKVFSIRDNKLDTFTSLITHTHTGQAERTLMELARDKQTAIAKYPDDYTMYQIGEYDEQSGLMTSIQPVQVMSAIQAVKQVS